MTNRICLVCCVLLLAAVPAAWAAPSPPAPADCAPSSETISFGSPQPLTQQDIEKLNPLQNAQQAQTNCCTQQDWDQCYGNVVEGCWVQLFGCYQYYCQCWYQCW